MVAVTAIVGIRKHLIFVLIIANPIPAAFGAGQVPGFAA